MAVFTTPTDFRQFRQLYQPTNKEPHANCRWEL